MNSIKLTIYSERIPSKKNSKQIFWNKRTNKPFIVSSEKHKEFVKNATIQALQWKILNQGKLFTFPIKRCRIAMYFFFIDNRKVDLDNKCATILDLLVQTGILESDCWQVVRPIELDAGISKVTPRCEIFFSEASDEVKSR